MLDFFRQIFVLIVFWACFVKCQNSLARDSNFIPSQSRLGIPQDPFSENGPLPGLQRAPSTFQGFIGSGSSFMTNGLDLETFTKNSAIRANQENAIVAQLSNMAPVRRNQLARDISSGNISATNELVANLVRELTITPSGSVAFPSFSAVRDDSTSGMLPQKFFPNQQPFLLSQLLWENNRNRMNNPELLLNRQFQQQPILSSRNNFNNALNNRQFSQDIFDSNISNNREINSGGSFSTLNEQQQSTQNPIPNLIGVRGTETLLNKNSQLSNGFDSTNSGLNGFGSKNIGFNSGFGKGISTSGLNAFGSALPTTGLNRFASGISNFGNALPPNNFDSGTSNGFANSTPKNGLGGFNGGTFHNGLNNFRAGPSINLQNLNPLLNSQLNGIRTGIMSSGAGTFSGLSTPTFAPVNIGSMARPSNAFDLLSLAKNLQNNNNGVKLVETQDRPNIDVSVSAPISTSRPSVSTGNLETGFSEATVDGIEDGFGQRVPFFKDLKDSVLPPSTPSMKLEEKEELNSEQPSLFNKNSNFGLMVLSRPDKSINHQESTGQRLKNSEKNSPYKNLEKSPNDYEQKEFETTTQKVSPNQPISSEEISETAFEKALKQSNPEDIKEKSSSNPRSIFSVEQSGELAPNRLSEAFDETKFTVSYPASENESRNFTLSNKD